MQTIYCISGLGADEGAFSKLAIAGCELKIISWLEPFPKETITEYATRMCAGINEPRPVLMGLSFGGMMCIEIAKQIPVAKIILISSVKTTTELPLWMRTAGWLRLNRILPIKGNYKPMLPIQNYILGIVSDDERAVVAVSRKKSNTKYVKWAVDKVLNWNNQWQHPLLYHIHGDKDRMFPIKKLQPTYTVANGGHFMIMNKAEEVSRLIYECIK
jgi:pimeloyl-ACP methyl ester carboxylesterase